MLFWNKVSIFKTKKLISVFNLHFLQNTLIPVGGINFAVAKPQITFTGNNDRTTYYCKQHK
jgi:hypothetical protein